MTRISKCSKCVDKKKKPKTQNYKNACCVTASKSIKLIKVSMHH